MQLRGMIVNGAQEAGLDSESLVGMFLNEGKHEPIPMTQVGSTVGDGSILDGSVLTALF
jgi:hypothetical protein